MARCRRIPTASSPTRSPRSSRSRSRSASTSSATARWARSATPPTSRTGSPGSTATRRASRGRTWWSIRDCSRSWRSWDRPRSTAGRAAWPTIGVKDLGPMQVDIANMKAAIAAAKPRGEGFINTASPGTIALFQPNDFYKTQDAYLEAVAEGMRAEYEGLDQAGPAAADRRARHGDGPAHDVPRPHGGRLRRSRGAPHRGAEPRAAQCARRTACACTCAGATTRARTLMTCRWRNCCRW